MELLTGAGNLFNLFIKGSLIIFVAFLNVSLKYIFLGIFQNVIMVYSLHWHCIVFLVHGESLTPLPVRILECSFA